MPGLETFIRNAGKELKQRAFDAPEDLKHTYMNMAKPSYSMMFSSDESGESDKSGEADESGEAEFFISQARYDASHIMKGFASKDEFKDDLKALILRPALLTFEAAYHAVKFVLKLMEVFAHLVIALVDFLFQPPKEPKTGISGVIGRINPFDNKPEPIALPEADLKNAGDAAIDATESLIKLVLYPYVATVELYTQGFSFIAKCLFSLDESLGEKCNAAAESGKGYIQGLVAA